MTGVHINWTKPSEGKPYQLPQYKLLVQLLSVLYWKRFYGEIVLYTDDRGLDYYKNCGYPILDLYNEVNIDVLNQPLDIYAPVFWAGGKIVSISNEKTPFVMLDLDLFLTNDILSEFKDYDLVFSHFETLTNPVYPNPKSLTNISYELPNYDWSLLPGNVSITYFGNEQFKERYTKESIEYMKSWEAGVLKSYNDMYTSLMVFAEQRLLTCIANNMNIKYKPLIDDIYNSSTNEVKYNGSDINSGEEPSWFKTGNKNNVNSFPIHHTWGYKSMLVNRGLRILYTETLQGIIKKEFPEYEQYLKDPQNE